MRTSKNVLFFLGVLLSSCFTPVFAQLNAEFSANNLTLCGTDQVTFTDASSGSPVSWFWSFGDGGTSTVQNPTYAYQDTGRYTVYLVVADGLGTLDTVVKENYIHMQQPVARFVSNPTVGCAIPHTVFYTDQSILPDTWFWDFGDGNTSTLQNPVHNYTSTGQFVIRLTVTDTINGCSDVVSDTVRVSIPVADFTGSPLFGCGPLTTDFTDASTGAIAWAWDFGDGQTSAQQNPSHTYDKPGVYTVSLTITDSNGCTDTRTRPAYVQVIGPDVNFGGDELAGCNPHVVNFTDSTIFGAPITSWTWDFGDGTSSNLQNPAHQYNLDGKFNVKLTVTDIDGCTRTFEREEFVETASLEAEFEAELEPLLCNTLMFKDISAEPFPVTGRLWDFGDGTTESDDTLVLKEYTFSGVYTVCLIVTNVHCADTTCMSVQVEDLTPPEFDQCPDSVVAYADSNACSTTVTWDTPTAWDNCAVDSIVGSHDPGSVFPIGETEVVYVAHQGIFTDTCRFTVTVRDTLAPQFTLCPDSLRVPNDSGMCGALVSWMQVVTDNCDVDSVVSVPANGSFFGMGYTTVELVAFDPAMNTDTCRFVVEVWDSTATQYAELDTVICSGETFVFGGTLVDSTGMYTDRLTSASGCDSIVTLSVVVAPLPVVELADFGSDTLSLNGGPYTLPEGTPSGGVYMGDGIDSLHYDPLLVGTGKDVILYIVEDSLGCYGIDSTVVFIINDTRVPQLEVGKITVYPNPVRDFLTLDMKTAQDRMLILEFVDVSGKIVRREQLLTVGKTRKQIDVSDLAEGTYSLNLSNEKGELRDHKIIIKL